MTPFMKALIVINSIFSGISLLYVYDLMDRHAPNDVLGQEISRLNDEVRRMEKEVNDMKNAVERLNADVVPRK